MDGRKILMLALVASLPCLGCAGPQKEPPENTKTASLANMVGLKDAEDTRREIRIVSEYARVCEGHARDPKRTGAERERLLEEARKTYQQVLKITPDHIEAAAGLARVHIALGNHERGLAVYAEVLKKHPKEAKLWSDLSLCHAKRKDFGKAVECCKKALELDPENRSCANTLAVLLAGDNKTDEGLGILRRLHGEPQAQLKMAQILIRLNRADQSRQHLQLALQQDPNLTPARDLLAQLQQDEQPIATVGFQTADSPP